MIEVTLHCGDIFVQGYLTDYERRMNQIECPLCKRYETIKKVKRI